MRALIVSSRYPSEAQPYLGNFVERQCLELAARGRIALEVVHVGRDAPFPGSDVRRGMKVYRLGYAVDRDAREREAERVTQALLRHAEAWPSIDVVAAQFFWPEGPAAVALARKLGAAVSIKARGEDFRYFASCPDTAGTVLGAAGEADGLLAISAHMRAAMAGFGIDPGRIEVHRSGIDRNLFRLRDRASDKAALKEAGPLLLSVGNLIARKRHELAIEAVALLPQARLIVAGGGPEHEPLVAKARALGVAERVRFFGPVPHELLPVLFSAADCTLHCAVEEGLGNVLIESLACGTPVVTAGAGGAAELIDREAAGRIVAPDAAAMAAAIEELLGSPPEPSLVAAAAERFSWERNAEQLERHFEGLVRRSRSLNPLRTDSPAAPSP